MINPDIGVERKKFIEDNVALVYFVAKNYFAFRKRVGVDQEDIIQYGIIGLIKAYDNFRLDKGAKSFSTYAIPVIRNEIRMALLKAGGMLHFSKQVKELAYKIHKSNLAEATPEEIAKEFGVTIKAVKYALYYHNNMDSTSLNFKVYDGDNKEVEMMELIPSYDSYTNIYMNEFMKGLSPREHQIFTLHLEGYKQDDIAIHTGISQSYVSRVLKSVIKKAKDFLVVH